jgi:hypothetical protein
MSLGDQQSIPAPTDTNILLLCIPDEPAVEERVVNTRLFSRATVTSNW